MATVSGTTSGKAKGANGSSATPGSHPAATKKAPTKRAAARPRSATTRSKLSKATQNIPQWVTVGASVTGVVVAVGATLFATRNEWLPRARKLGEWVENSMQDQLDTIAATKSKFVEANEPEAPVVSPATTGLQ